MCARSILAAALSLAALAAASPVLADKDPEIAPYRPLEEKNFLSGKATIDPSKGYFYLHGKGPAFGVFLRIPDEQDLADYRFLTEKAYAKALRSYERAVASYDNDAKIARNVGRPVPALPVRPDAATFSIGDIGLRTNVPVGPFSRFSKASGESSFLEEVKPGTYIYYGPLASGPNGAMGTCFCMGSVRFEVKAGQITDLGDFLKVAPDWASQALSDLDPKAREQLSGPQTPHFGLPASLASYPSVQAKFHASGKLNNFVGAMVSRMPPVPGVLAYDRDVAIDVATGERVVLGFARPAGLASAAIPSAAAQP